MARDHALVVEAHQSDDILDVASVSILPAPKPARPGNTGR
jgi:hypothetical protein